MCVCVCLCLCSCVCVCVCVLRINYVHAFLFLSPVQQRFIRHSVFSYKYIIVKCFFLPISTMYIVTGRRHIVRIELTTQ